MTNAPSTPATGQGRGRWSLAHVRARADLPTEVFQETSVAPLEFSPPLSDYLDMTTEISPVSLPAPRVTATVLRAVLSHPAGLAVQLPTGDVEAAPAGLTKAQSLNPDLVVVLTHAEATEFLSVSDGDHVQAARDVTMILRAEHARMAKLP